MKKTILLPFLVIQTLAVSAYSADYLKFSQACSSDEDVQVIAVGDILLHGPLQTQATKDPQRYKSLWATMIPMISGADVAYANLEGPVAENTLQSGREKDVGFIYDKEVYSSYPRFNYPNLLPLDIKNSGFDVVSTANNHAMDRTSVGADKTIQALDAAGLQHTGTKSSQPGEGETWYTITRAKDRNIAWLACSFSTNGVPDKFQQVLPCFEHREKLLGLITELSQRHDIDAVIVTPHWGVEYELTHNKAQEQLGHQMIEAGALAVIGTHPHVIQQWEKYTTKTGREGFIIYSTGNFVSGQSPQERRTSMMISLHLTAKPTEKLQIRGLEYIPLLITRTNKYQVVDARQKYLAGTAPAQSDGIWTNNFSKEQIMRDSAQESLNYICNRSKN